MLMKKEFMMRLCEVENNIDWIFQQLDDFDKRLGKLEAKRTRKNETTK